MSARLCLWLGLGACDLHAFAIPTVETQAWKAFEAQVCEKLEARVGIGHSLELVVPFAQLSQLAPPEARSILDASSTPRFNGFFVCVKHSAARTD